MAMLLNKIGNVLIAILKFVLRVFLGLLTLILDLAKVFLLLLHMVFKIFMVFVEAGTP